LCAIGGSAGVAQDATAIFQGVRGGGDRVDEATFFSDFGEESRAHTIAEDSDDTATSVIFGVGVGYGVVGECDVRLLAFVVDMRLGAK
jgi:hypothetical protein